ncbi:hypothetical protein Xmau_02574 [Xenorhabdus mauleonii]|uniref:Uncharacterized protein n=1 Tax=Xenorhabdus mauleonii TaxID=351675 RepID=A0A1I3U042_9GAMM|nr:hypothetical protein Xmau_02574 [Xenorhabdus mauleonii]SFJ75151.1 hypothetical protein SAMN05421680_11556 [Xenorhabdus mauleonii]
MPVTLVENEPLMLSIRERNAPEKSIFMRILCIIISSKDQLSVGYAAQQSRHYVNASNIKNQTKSCLIATPN